MITPQKLNRDKLVNDLKENINLLKEGLKIKYEIDEALIKFKANNNTKELAELIERGEILSLEIAKMDLQKEIETKEMFLNSFVEKTDEEFAIKENKIAKFNSYYKEIRHNLIKFSQSNLVENKVRKKIKDLFQNVDKNLTEWTKRSDYYSDKISNTYDTLKIIYDIAYNQMYSKNK